MAPSLLAIKPKSLANTVKVLFAHYCAWVFYGRSLDQGKVTVEIPVEDIPLALRAFYFGEVT